MSFPRYDVLEPTGVEWLGPVPGQWRVQPLKTIAEFTNGEAFKPSEWSEEGVPIIRIQNLNGGDDFNFFSGTVDERYHVQFGDLLFGWSGNRGTSFGPFRWKRDGLHYLNQHIFKVASKNVDGDWLYWCLKGVTAYVEQQAHGIIGMVHVTQGRLGGITVPVPSQPEQTAIASFLDRETAKIDALVEEQRRLIELLKEKRQAVISHAVTKGLDPTVPMKDSGVEWLGQVPAHWEVRPVGSLLRESPCYGVLVPDSAPEGVPMLRITDMQDGVASRDGLVTISPALSAQYQRTIVAAGDLLLSVVGTIGESLIVDDELAGVNLSRAVARLQPNDVSTADYMRWIFRSSLFEHFVDLTCVGTAQRVLNMGALGSMRVPVPPRNEQDLIASSLYAGTTKLEALIREAQSAARLLQERRAALVSAAVTGKIDVREVNLRRAEAA